MAVGLAFVLAQLGFIGHDAGHRQICARRRDNDLIGLVVANLFAGFSFGWWLAKHNRHHAHTNRPDKDPDMVPGALVYTPDQVAAVGGSGAGSPASQAVDAGAPAVPRGAQPARGQRASPSPAVGTGVPWSSPGCSPSTCSCSSWRRSSSSPRCGRGVHRRHPVVVRLLPGSQLPHQPRGDAHPGRPRRTRVPPPTGAHLPQPVRPDLHRLPLRGSGHPDRAPSVPDHAPGQPAAGTEAGPPVLRRAPDRLRRAEPVAGLLREVLAPPTAGSGRTGFAIE